MLGLKVGDEIAFIDLVSGLYVLSFKKRMADTMVHTREQERFCSLDAAKRRAYHLGIKWIVS